MSKEKLFTFTFTEQEIIDIFECFMITKSKLKNHPDVREFFNRIDLLRNLMKKGIEIKNKMEK